MSMKTKPANSTGRQEQPDVSGGGRGAHVRPPRDVTGGSQGDGKGPETRVADAKCSLRSLVLAELSTIREAC